MDVTQPPRAHHIFQNEDIVSNIVAFIESPYSSYQDRRELLCASLISKTFFGPAASSLWRMQDAILPLLSVLPNFKVVNGVYNVGGIITPAQWNRVVLYGSKIKTLRLGTDDGAMKWRDIHHLSNLSPPLFPNLWEVEVDMNSTKTINVIFLTASKSLESVHIYGIGSKSGTEETTISYLSILNHKQAPLRNIKLFGENITRHTLNTINMFTGLTKLSISGATLDFLVFRSWSITLLSLMSLYLSDFVIASGVENRNQQGRIAEESSAAKHLIDFHVLEALHLNGPIDGQLELLQSIQTCETLNKINLVLISNGQLLDDEQSLLDCIEASLRISGSSLQTFTIIAHDKQRGPHFALPKQTLLLLSQYQQLCLLELTLLSEKHRLAYDDDVIQLSCGNNNWCHLTKLSLPDAVEGCAPSIHCLTIIARNCPVLEYLTICVDFQLHTYESLLAERTGPRMLHKLGSLCLHALPGSPPIGSGMKMSVAISRYIEYHFQCLKLWPFSFITPHPSDKTWFKGLLEIIDELRALRAEAHLESNSPPS